MRADHNGSLSFFVNTTARDVKKVKIVSKNTKFVTCA